MDVIETWSPSPNVRVRFTSGGPHGRCVEIWRYVGSDTWSCDLNYEHEPLPGVNGRRTHHQRLPGPAGFEMPPPVDDGHYLSTACYHEREPGREALHDECETGGTRWDGSTKVPAQCKYGLEPEPCRCPGHKPNGGSA